MIVRIASLLHIAYCTLISRISPSIVSVRQLKLRSTTKHSEIGEAVRKKLQRQQQEIPSCYPFTFPRLAFSNSWLLYSVLDYALAPLIRPARPKYSHDLQPKTYVRGTASINRAETPSLLHIRTHSLTISHCRIGC